MALASAAALAAVAWASDPRDRLETLNLRETALNAEQGRTLNRMARLLSLLQQLRRNPPPALLVNPQDAKDAVRAAILVKAMTPELQARSLAFAAEAKEIARQRRLAAVASEALFTAESESAEYRKPDDGLIPSDEPELRGTLNTTLEDPVVAPATLLPPSPGPVSQAFGAALPGGGHSNGLTIATARGAAVRSPADGRLEYAGPVKGWGVILIFRLTGGYHLVLAGLDRASLDIGQSVAAGAPVGWMPDDRQSQSELYLEVRERGVPVDPERWLAKGAG